jgi:cobalt-zinc-cadmium efflux system outer membrane protein
LKADFGRVLKQSIYVYAFAVAFLTTVANAQQALTWEQVKAKFEAASPLLKADAANVDEMKAEEITAFLRPNPQFTVAVDGTQIAPHDGVWTPVKGTTEQPNFSYLHEREHKRELRLQSAKEGTEITQSQHIDLERNLIFGLRSAFVQTLQAKAILELAKADLEYYDKIIDISRARFNAGDLAKIDLARIELQRVQYESEIETAIVNLRTQKIQLLLLLDDRTPVDQFDVTGTFDLGPELRPLSDYHQIALDNRPDLRAAYPMVPLTLPLVHGTPITHRPIIRTPTRHSGLASASRCGYSTRTRARRNGL